MERERWLGVEPGSFVLSSSSEKSSFVEEPELFVWERRLLELEPGSFVRLFEPGSFSRRRVEAGSFVRSFVEEPEPGVCSVSEPGSFVESC